MVDAVKRFQDVHALYEEVIEKIPEKGVMFNDITSYIQEVCKIFSRDMNTIADRDFVYLDIYIELYNIPMELGRIISTLYKDDHHVKDAFNKAFYMKLYESEIDVLKKDLTLIFIPEEVQKKGVGAGAYINNINTIFIFVPDFDIVYNKTQLKELVRYLHTSTVLYHELTHFVQSSDWSYIVSKKIINTVSRRIGVNIGKSYEQRNIEIEAHIVSSVVNYIQNTDPKGRNFTNDMYKDAIACHILNFDKSLENIYMKMSERNRQKTFDKLGCIVDYLREDSRTLSEIINNYDYTNLSPELEDRLMNIFD